ncbi:MAG: nitroreductase family protein [Pseudomonadota bacterium]
MKDHDHQPLDDFIEYPPSEMQRRATAFYDDIRRRHSIRTFSDRPVPRQVIETCIAAAGTAPNGANHQPWHFAAINSPSTKQRIREKAEAEERAFYSGRASDEWLDALSPLGTDADKPYLEVAPWLIAIFAQRRGGVEIGETRKNYYITESVGIATGFLIAALHQAGLGTLTHTPNPMSFLNEVCHRPSNEKPFLLLVTGFPADEATVPLHALRKKPLEEIMSVL